MEFNIYYTAKHRTEIQTHNINERIKETLKDVYIYIYIHIY